MSQAASTKPYLIRALFDWCVDNGFTPYVVVSVDENTRVPMAYVRDGQIVLNIAPYATHQLQISNDSLSCQARFGGAAHSLYVPIANVAAIYAKENGQGMAFELGESSGAGIELGGINDQDDEDDDLTEIIEDGQPVTRDTAADPEGPSDPAPTAGNRGHLRVIK